MRRRNLEFIKQNRLSDANTLLANQALAFRTKPANRTALEQCQLAHTALALAHFKTNLENIHEYDVTVCSLVVYAHVDVFVCVRMGACVITHVILSPPHRTHTRTLVC